MPPGEPRPPEGLLLPQAVRRDPVANSAATASVLVIRLPLLPWMPNRNDGDIVRPVGDRSADGNLKPA